MSVVSIATLKTYFQTGDTPTESQFVDLIDTFSSISTSPAQEWVYPFEDGLVRTVDYFPDSITVSTFIKDPAVSSVNYSVNGGSLQNGISTPYTFPANSRVVWTISYVSPSPTSEGFLYLKGTKN